jgi:hypothetical protein
MGEINTLLAAFVCGDFMYMWGVPEWRRNGQHPKPKRIEDVGK